MRKINLYFIVFITIVNLGALVVIATRKDNTKVSNLSASELIDAIKQDPILSKKLGDISTSSKSLVLDSKGDKGDAGKDGAVGPRGATGASGTNSNLEEVLGIDLGGTGATSPATAVNNLLPSQSGKAGKLLGTDGSNPSWVNSTNGFVKLNSIVVPRGTTTTITSDQIKAGLMIEVAPSDGTDENRPMMKFPSPVDDPSLTGYIVQIVAQQKYNGLNRNGASFGYPQKMPAILGDFLATSFTTLDFSITPLDIVYEVNGIEKNVTLNQDYSSHPEDLVADIFAEALLEGTIDIEFSYDVPGNGNPDMALAVVTVEKGDTASVSIVEPGDGDPLGLLSLDAISGFTGYLGYDEAHLGIGELNVDNPIGGGYTHTWPDDPYGIDQQNLSVIATSTGWQSLRTSPRSEFVSFSPTLNWFLDTNDRNLGKILNVFDEEIYNIRSRLDALE